MSRGPGLKVTGSFNRLFMLCCLVTKSLTPWTVTCQTPLSMGFSRQEYWCGLLFPPPGDLPNPGIKSVSPVLTGKFFATEPPGKPY